MPIRYLAGFARETTQETPWVLESIQGLQSGVEMGGRLLIGESFVPEAEGLRLRRYGHSA